MGTPNTADPRDLAVDAAGGENPQSPSLDLRQLHRHLAAFVKATHAVDQMAGDTTAFVARLTNAQLVVYFSAASPERLDVVAEHRVAVSDEIGKIWREMLAEQAAKSCAEDQLHIVRLQQNRVAISVPVHCHGAKIDSLAAVFLLGAERAETFVVILQLVAGLLAAYHLQRANQATDWEINTSCALLDLIVTIGRADAVDDAGVLLVNAVKNFLGCDRVAIGFNKRRGASSCKLLAVSGMSDLNRQAEIPQAVQGVLAEAVRANEWTVWPSDSERNQPLMPAHARLSAICEDAKICSAPLRGADGAVVGAWVFWGFESTDMRWRTEQFARVSAGPVGSSLQLLQHGQINPLSRQLRKWRLFERKSFWISAAAVMLLCCSFWPYKIGCDCAIEPVKKRYVVAPFAGVFEKSLVRPGDVVAANQKLARMDGRELRMELAGVVADYQRAHKSRDVNVAAGKTGASQIDSLEMQGLEQKRQLLESRIENLDIKSPVVGIVVTGDLERTEGAPVTAGQALYEIAPLDRMIVEVEVRDEDIANVAAGQDATIRLDAYPGRSWQGKIDKIHPRSEIRDSKNVFVAEVSLPENAESLRPGMKGTATVTTTSHALLWILFHKAWYGSLKWLGM
jgi:biotin carboxyl carrier protein